LNRSNDKSSFASATHGSRLVAACTLAAAFVALAACEAPPTPQAPECQERRDCEDGFACVSGVCEIVRSTVGDRCVREADCGPGQTCAATGYDGDADGDADTLAPSCQLAIGRATGAACDANDQCASIACSLGHCAELCLADLDCRGGSACVGVPYMFSPRAVDQFGGCMPAAGVLAVDLPVDDSGLVHVPVPTHALSMTLVTAVGDPSMLVGMTRLVSPSGTLLWNTPAATDAIAIEQPLRYTPSTETSSVMLPSSSEAPLEPGVYRAHVAAWQPNAQLARVLPRVHAIFRLGVEGRTLDLNFHFMNLSEHACLGERTLSAKRVVDKQSPWQAEFLPAWRAAFAPAGLTLGAMTFDDQVERPELDAVRPDELGKLFALGVRGRAALDVYVVRSIYPLGSLAAVGGTPGPLEHRTTHSGIVISADALCVLGWDDFGRIAAHAAARYLGLYESVDVDGRHDPLVSTGDTANNIVYFRLGSSPELTDEQAAILRTNPVLR